MCRIVCILVLCGISPPALAQTVTLRHTPVVGEVGEIVEANVVLDTDFEIFAWSYSVCPDPDTVTTLGASPGSTTATILSGGPPAFQSIQFYPDGLSDSVVLCFVGCAPLSPGDEYEILDIEYEVNGLPGAVGEICFCALGAPPVMPLFTLPSGTVIVPFNDCVSTQVAPCTPIVANRGVESFDVLTRAGEPGRFDLVVHWVVETATPQIDLSTTVEILVGSAIVGTASQISSVGTLTCCDDPGCVDTCGLWFTGLTFTAGQCAFSPVQGACACRLNRTTTFLDIEIPEGVPVTARVRPKSGAVAETILEDDEITRLAPYFNRQLVRTAWIPDPANPGNVLGFGFVTVTASAVDAEVDFGFDLVVAVGGAAAAQTEVQIRIPNGVDPCLTLNCESECQVPLSGPRGYCRPEPCAVCTQAIGVSIGSLATPSPGTGYEFEILPFADALAEASAGDDVIVATYTGLQPAPNRRVRPSASSYSPSAFPDCVDVVLAWRAETGGTLLENLSTQFQIEVNGAGYQVVDSPTILGASGASCSPCLGTACATWTIDGLPTIADCEFSAEQSTCVCGVDLVATLLNIPATAGDTVTITLIPALEGITEVLNGDDTITFEISPPFVRGNVNADASIDLADAISLLLGLFDSGPLSCHDAADVDDDGVLGIADPIVLLAFLFEGAVPPVSPFPSCGPDPTADALGCASFPMCP